MIADLADVDWQEVFISAPVKMSVVDVNSTAIINAEGGESYKVREGARLTVTRTENHKCGRCWRHLPEVTEDGALCNRCETVLDAR